MPRFFIFLGILVSLCQITHAACDPSGPRIGSIAPEFTARDLLTRERIPLSSQRGKIIILSFRASWCPPCRRELPLLENAQVLLGKDKLTVFAVNYREHTEAMRDVAKLAAKWHITIVDDPLGWIASHYAVSKIPHLFVIGRDGTSSPTT